MKNNCKKHGLCLGTGLIYAVYFVVMCWLHYQQLCSTDAFASDLPYHLKMAEEGTIYSATSFFLLFAYALGKINGLAILVALFQLAALAVFAWGMRTAAPGLSVPARLLISLVVNLAQAVWIPRGGYWYLGTVNGTI